MADKDLTTELTERVRACLANGTAIAPEGGASKRFLGRQVEVRPLSVAGHQGIVSYEPTELVITARAGTSLVEVEQVLAGRGQMLPFEPPHFGSAATVGGTVAAGLSGPRRPYAGAARDFVLGTRVINGNAECLRFGGEVMKNVAGYDVSRLLTGSMGTLGVLLDVSLKVLPRPAHEATLCLELDAATAIRKMNTWAGEPHPISAACHFDGLARLRLSGSEAGVEAAATRVGGVAVDEAEELWRDLREQRLAFFAGELPLWRISVPPASPPLALPGVTLVDWGGALRWLRTEADPSSVRSVVSRLGGHAMLFRGGDRQGAVYHPLDASVLRLHQRIKAAFDPKGIFNPARMYPEL